MSPMKHVQYILDGHVGHRDKFLFSKKKLEWPFIVMSPKHNYATIMLYQFADMPQESGGCIILENGNCSLPLILRNLQYKPKIR